jgi:hypothetical protein
MITLGGVATIPLHPQRGGRGTRLRSTGRSCRTLRFRGRTRDRSSAGILGRMINRCSLTQILMPIRGRPSLHDVVQCWGGFDLDHAACRELSRHFVHDMNELGTEILAIDPCSISKPGALQSLHNIGIYPHQLIEFRRPVRKWDLK